MVGVSPGESERRWLNKVGEKISHPALSGFEILQFMLFAIIFIPQIAELAEGYGWGEDLSSRVVGIRDPPIHAICDHCIPQIAELEERCESG
jgi:hypothetical protein